MPGSRRRNAETGLTAQQQRFADEYLVDFDATAAHYRSGYKARGVSGRNSAKALLARPAVQAYLHGRTQLISAQLKISSERSLQELARIAFFDIRRLFSSDGKLKPIGEWDDDSAAAVISVESTGGSAKVRLASKVDALGKLALHLGLFRNKLEVTGKDGAPLQHEYALIESLVDAVDGAETGIKPTNARTLDAPKVK